MRKIALLLLFQISMFSLMAQQSKSLDYSNLQINQGGQEEQIGNISTVSTSGLRKQISTATSASVMAAPANNNCANATSIVVGAPCINGTTKESTVQAGESFSCQGTPTQTVWYKFVATATNMFVEVDWTASSGCYLSSAVYSGSCLPSTSLSCEDAAGGPFLNIHNLTGLTIGTTYFIQVSYTSGGACGGLNGPGATTTGADFCINVGQTVSCGTCNNPCGPMCIFGSTPTVAQVTGTCTRYDLQSRLNAGQTRTQCYTFTSPGTSFSLQMIINSVGCAGGNVTNFDWQLYPSGCGSVVQSGNLTNLNATGLSVGTSYVLCYTWTAACEHNSVYPYMVATAPLPIELIHFEAETQLHSVLIHWITSSELNNDYFSIQRSGDGSNFVEIGKVNGAGNSNNYREYEFNDSQPLKGLSYYKLVQIDYDKTQTSSNIVAVRMKEENYISIFQNAVSDLLQIEIVSDNSKSFTIYVSGVDGKVVLKKDIQVNKSNSRVEIPVEMLSQGMYFLQVTGQNTKFNTKFIKQ